MPQLRYAAKVHQKRYGRSIQKAGLEILWLIMTSARTRPHMISSQMKANQNKSKTKKNGVQAKLKTSWMAYIISAVLLKDLSDFLRES